MQGATEQQNSYRDLERWIEKARLLSEWRNNRVHGRIVYDASTSAAYLVDETDNMLDADHDTCIAKAQEAYRLVDELEGLTTTLLHDAKLTQLIDSI